MKFVKDKTGLDFDKIVDNQLAFEATPSECQCGHKWNAFDVIIDAVKRSGHDWKFFSEALVGEFGGFFRRKTDLTCNECGQTADGIEVMYKYKRRKALGWGY